MIRPIDPFKLENEIKELQQKVIELTPKRRVFKEDYYAGTRS